MGLSFESRAGLNREEAEPSWLPWGTAWGVRKRSCSDRLFSSTSPALCRRQVCGSGQSEAGAGPQALRMEPDRHAPSEPGVGAQGLLPGLC